MRLSAAAKGEQVTDLLAFAQDQRKPEVMAGAVHVKGPAPKILGSKTSLPPQANIPLREGELLKPRELRERQSGGEECRAGDARTVRLRCAKSAEGAITLRVGEKSDNGSAQALSADELFVSFDPGTWQAGCGVTAVLDNGGSGQSKPFVLGKVVRLPHVEAFELTEEKNGDNYIGKLTGSDLENIAQVGWNADHGIPVAGLPTPVGGDKARKQVLGVELPWPSPSPHAPLFVWFRGETDGRATGIKY